MILHEIELLFNVPFWIHTENVCSWKKTEESGIITDGDLFSRLNVSLGKEDGDAGSFVVDGAGVRLAGVIHAGDT